MTDAVELQSTLDEVLKEAQFAITTSEDLQSLDEIKNKYFSKKGYFSQLMPTLAKANAADRPVLGKMINECKQQLQSQLQAKIAAIQLQIQTAALAAQSIDISLPGRRDFQGGKHPVTLVREWVEDWFAKLGFVVRTGPEIEDDFHNFTALNIPDYHPARAMQDTFYFNPSTVLRTQTSNVQVHVMENETLPIRIIAPGRVYRSDYDMTHSPMFHQCEGLVIDESANFSDLKGVILNFLQDFFGRKDLQVRFRPSFFPFTEPSAEVDIGFSDDANDPNIQWLEVLGCGVVHPNVLKNVNIDSKKYQGYAFGMGIERLAMLRYQVKDLRLFFENDLRFLKQFKHEF